MIDSIIVKYLQENRRLVIPKLGAFIVKDDNQTVIFSELLRSDDGVLRGLIKQHGVGDIEAAGVIDRFVFEVRHTLDRNMPYKIGSWGTLRRDERGKIVFMSFRSQPQQPVQGQAPRPVHKIEVATQQSNTLRDNRVGEGESSSGENPKRRKPRRKPDLFMIVAAVVAFLAICAILYGVLGSKVEEEPMPFPEIENVEPGVDAVMDVDSQGDAQQN